MNSRKRTRHHYHRSAQDHDVESDHVDGDSSRRRRRRWAERRLLFSAWWCLCFILDSGPRTPVTSFLLPQSRRREARSPDFCSSTPVGGWYDPRRTWNSFGPSSQSPGKTSSRDSWLLLFDTERDHHHQGTTVPTNMDLLVVAAETKAKALASRTAAAPSARPSAPPDGLPASPLIARSTTLQEESAETITSNTKEELDFMVDAVDWNEEMPRPTEHGGYTHTKASKAKISAANRGKTPWNKGRQRSEEEKARIAAGVRARNRQVFLQKLADLGLTEQQYEDQKKEERRRREEERRARMTDKGGYRPTEETRQKISHIMKEKYANGQVLRKPVHPDKVRRNFTHSDETRAKISESLRRRWAEDPEYRENMIYKASKVNTQDHVRQRISETLRLKWQDPEFRSDMLTRMETRSRPAGGNTHDASHREKISAAMKAKWQDEEYRKKTLESISRRRALEPTRPKAPSRPPKTDAVAARKPKEPKKPSATIKVERAADMNHATPPHLPFDVVKVVEPLKKPQKGVSKKTATRSELVNGNDMIHEATRIPPVARIHASDKVSSRKMASPSEAPRSLLHELRPSISDHQVPPTTKRVSSPDKTPPTRRPKDEGSVQQLREERRDLYDLLYGDEDDADGPLPPSPLSRRNIKSKLSSMFALEDENLDQFDPYGLQDY